MGRAGQHVATPPRATWRPHVSMYPNYCGILRTLLWIWSERGPHSHKVTCPWAPAHSRWLGEATAMPGCWLLSDVAGRHLFGDSMLRGEASELFGGRGTGKFIPANSCWIPFVRQPLGCCGDGAERPPGGWQWRQATHTGCQRTGCLGEGALVKAVASPYTGLVLGSVSFSP